MRQSFAIKTANKAQIFQEFAKDLVKTRADVLKSNKLTSGILNKANKADEYMAARHLIDSYAGGKANFKLVPENYLVNQRAGLFTGNLQSQIDDLINQAESSNAAAVLARKNKAFGDPGSNLPMVDPSLETLRNLKSQLANSLANSKGAEGHRLIAAKRYLSELGEDRMGKLTDMYKKRQDLTNAMRAKEDDIAGFFGNARVKYLGADKELAELKKQLAQHNKDITHAADALGAHNETANLLRNFINTSRADASGYKLLNKMRMNNIGQHMDDERVKNLVSSVASKYKDRIDESELINMLKQQSGYLSQYDDLLK
jgi:hypothetical protein